MLVGSASAMTLMGSVWAMTLAWMSQLAAEESPSGQDRGHRHMRPRR